MEGEQMADKIQLRRDTAANWASTNPILSIGEMGLCTDELNIKVGNGVAAWNDLPYYITGTVYNDEMARDAIGAILTDTASIDFTYDDNNNQILAAVIPGGVNHDNLLNMSANKHVDHTLVSITGSDGLSGGGDISISRTITLPNVGTAGTYGNSSSIPVFTTDAKGRITAVTPTNISIGSGAVSDFVEAVQDAIGGALVNSASINFSYDDVNNTITATVNSLITNGVQGLQTLFVDVKDPTGFVNNNQIACSYSVANRTVTLTKTGGIEFYWRGVKTTLTSPWTSSAHSNTPGRYYLYSTDGTNFAWSNTTWTFSDLMVAVVYKTADYTFAINEVHGVMPFTVHEYLHENFGTFKHTGTGGGPETGTYSLNVDSNAATTPGFTATSVLDEDNETVIAAWPEGTYTTLRIGSGGISVFDIASSYPFRASGSYILVNNVGDGTEIVATNGRFVNVYQILIPVTADSDSQKYRMTFLQPQNQYTALADAVAESFYALPLGDLNSSVAEMVPYVRLTYETGSSNNSYGKVRLANVTTVAKLAGGSGGGSIGASAVGSAGWIQYRGSTEGSFGAEAALWWDSNRDCLKIGTATGLNTTDTPLEASASAASWLQINVQNTSTANASSSDFVATMDTGTDLTGFIDLGINCSGYNQAAYNSGGPGDAYLMVNGGDLALITETAHNIGFYTNGATTAQERMMIYSNGDVTVGGTAPLATSAASGFFWIPTMSGMPTGTISVIAGKKPLVMDTTNNVIWYQSNLIWRSLNNQFVAANVGGYVAGNFYDQSRGAAAATTLAAAANRLDVMPFTVWKDLTIDQIGIAVSTGATGNANVVIYESDPTTGWPSNRIYVSANLSTASIAYVQVAYSYTFRKGVRYWIGVHTSAAPSLRSIPIANLHNLGIAGSTGTTYYSVLRQTVTFGSSPATWTFASAQLTSSDGYSIRMRAA